MLGTEIVAFGYIEVEKSKFHRYKNTIFFEWYDILVSNKISFTEKKYAIGYLDENKVKPLTIILPKTNAYIRSYDDQNLEIKSCLK